MKSDADKKVFATLRVVGDGLDPEEITSLLHVEPTTAHAKGERYSGSNPKRRYRGKTGVWYLSTEKIVDSDELEDHLNFLVGLFVDPKFPSPYRGYSAFKELLLHLKLPLRRYRSFYEVLAKKSLKVVISGFWAGSAGSHPPKVPEYLLNAIANIPASFESDFEADYSEGRRGSP